MSWVAYRHINVCVYAKHILEMEGMGAIINWNKKWWKWATSNNRGHKMNF